MLTSNLTVEDAEGVEWTYSQTEDQDSSGFWYPEHWPKNLMAPASFATGAGSPISKTAISRSS